MSKSTRMPGKDKFVLVTGAYGGMGRASVLALRDLGYTVFAMDRTTGEREDGIIPITADLTNEKSILSAYEAVKSACSGLYAIIHYAGIYMLDSLVEMTGEDFERIFKINLFGAFHVNRIFMPLLSRGSRILITTSELAPLDPLPFTGIYAVSKAALDKYAYALAMELQLLGIRVSVLRAGATGTAMLGASVNALDRFVSKTKLYSVSAKRFHSVVESVEAKNVPPERVAARAAKIIAYRSPAFVYSVNRNPLLLLLAALPQRMQLWVISKILK